METSKQYGLERTAYPTSKDECGCIRIVNEYVVDWCQRHALNEIIHAIKELSSSVCEVAAKIEEKTPA